MQFFQRNIALKKINTLVLIITLQCSKSEQQEGTAKKHLYMVQYPVPLKRNMRLFLHKLLAFADKNSSCEVQYAIEVMNTKLGIPLLFVLNSTMPSTLLHAYGLESCGILFRRRIMVF